MSDALVDGWVAELAGVGGGRSVVGDGVAAGEFADEVVRGWVIEAPAAVDDLRAVAGVVGGTRFDFGQDIAVDRRHDVYVSGVTAGGFRSPATRRSRPSAEPLTGSSPTRSVGLSDLAIVQLDRRGRLRFASYLDGTGVDDNAGGAPELDARGHFYVSGVTNSVDFPVTPDAIQATYGGGDIDGLLAKISLSQMCNRNRG